MSAWPRIAFAIEAMKAEIDGGAVEGRIAVSSQRRRRLAVRRGAESGTSRSRRGHALARSLAGPQAEWPDEAQLSLDIGRAISAGQELRPFAAKLGYGPKTISLDQLKIGGPNGVTVEGAGSFDRANATGRLALNSSAASFAADHRPDRAVRARAAARLNAMEGSGGPGAAQTDARSRQERRTGRARQRARRARPRCAAAQGRRHGHGAA